MKSPASGWSMRKSSSWKPTKKTLEIAWLAGFTDHDRMGKVFRRVLGVTPASYRKRFKNSATE